MNYKNSFAALISFTLERDLINFSVEEVINKMKAEYETEDFEEAVMKQLLSLCPPFYGQFGKYSKLIDDVLANFYNEGYYFQVW